MGCNTSDILGTAYRNGYAKLSARDLMVAAIAAACSTCNAQPLIEAAIVNGYLKLTEFDVAMCIANALCSSPGAAGAAAPTALSAAIQNHLLSMSRRDLDAVITAVLCKQTNPPCVTPTAPINPTAKVVTPTTIFIIWNQPANTGSLITGYTVKWGTVSGTYPNSAVVPAIPKNYLITGLTAGTQYFFVVQANSIASAGCSSANSSEGNATTAGGVVTNGLLNSLISYWKFDNVSGVTTPDSIGANALALSAGATTGAAAGIINTALDISTGSSTARPASQTDFTFGAGVSFTFSFWAFSTNWSVGVGTFICLLSKVFNAIGAREYIFVIENDVGVNYTAWNIIDTNGAGATVNFGLPSNSAFHHYVMGFDASISSAFGQIDNGARIITPATSNGTRILANTVFSLGEFNPGGEPALAGMRMDEMGLWRRALSTTDVTNLYNGGAALPLSSFQT